jgi:two-component system, sensor histidine kinase PdtaS
MYEKQNNFDKSLESFKKGYAAAVEENNLRSQAAIGGNIGFTYVLRKEAIKGIPYLKEGMEVAKKIKAGPLLADLCRNLGDAYAESNNFKLGYEYMGRYTLMSDSLLTVQVAEKTAELQEKYNSEKKEKENLALKLVNDRKTAGLIGIALLALLTGLFGFLLYRRNQQLRQQNHIIAEQKTAIADQKAELKHRTAWQIQSLQNVINQYSALEKDDKTPIKDLESRVNAIAELFHLLEHSGQKAVNMSIYLSKIVEKVVAQYTGAKENLSIDIQISDNLNMNPSREAMPIGRICNELLMNALKYAFEPNFIGGHITISLKESEKEYQFDLTDNGQGMSTPLSIQLEKKPFGGLFLVNSFAETLRGQFTTSAVVPTGTQHTIVFPK